MWFFRKKRSACIVLGMHRSGTSALTQLISACGADLPVRLMPGAASNEVGHFEPQALVDGHDKFLAACNSNWFDIRPLQPNAIPASARALLEQTTVNVLRADYAGATMPLIKDPRMCRFFPLTRDVLASLGLACSVVLALRSPVAVAKSLARRDGMASAYAGLLWAQHMICAERDSRGDPRIAVCYDEMLEDWRPTVTRIRQLPGRWLFPSSEAVKLTRTLRHHQDSDAVTLFGPTLGPLVSDLYAAFSGLVEGDDAEQRQRIDAIGARVIAASSIEAGALEAEYTRLGGRRAG